MKVETLLAKPISRPQLVLGKYAGLVLTLLLPESIRPAVLFGRMEGTVRRLPIVLRIPLFRILRLSAGGAS